jgi:hypothetical protein
VNVTELNEMIASAAAVRRRYEGDAYLNLAFLTGHQWVRWDNTRLFKVEIDDGSWEQTTDNRIRPFVRTEIAKLTKNKPTFIAVPKSSSDNDISAARFAADALEYSWQNFNLAAKLRQALLWSRVTPAGFWKVWWDKSIGRKRPVLVYGQDHEQAGKLVRDQFGGPLDPNGQIPENAPYEQRQVAVGEICVELRSFFHVYLDPHVPESGIEDAEWIGEEAVYSRGWVKRHFPDFADHIQYDQDPTPGAMEARLPFAGLTPSTTGAGKGAKIRELWTEDEHYVWCGDTQMLQEPNPYPWLPYVAFRASPVPGRFYGDPVINDLRPLQVDLNMRESQVAEHTGRLGNPPLLIPSTMWEEFNSWEAMPGDKIPYQDTGSPTSMPQFLQMPPLGDGIENDIARKLNSMMEISGQHEVSQAQVPQGVTAAAAISQLQEADNTRMGPDVYDMEGAITRAGQMILWLMGHYYEDGRMLTVSGEGGEWDFRAWKRGITTGVDTVRVQEGSMMPQSQGANQAAIQQFATLFSQNNPGAITPRGWANVLQKMQVGGLEAFFAQINRDQQQVNDENRRMAQGEPIQINSYDADEAHVDFHTDFQKTPGYRTLPDQAKAMFEQHLLAHRQRIDAIKAMQMQNAQIDPNQPPPPAGTTPPGVAPSPPAGPQDGPPIQGT